jgi:glutamate carboxypeptidase
MTDNSSIFRRVLDEGREKYVAELGALCALECGTEMVDGVNEVVSLVEKRLSALGLNTERRRVDGYGDHLVATTGVEGKQIVLGGHLDTTYTDYAQLPDFHIDGDYAIGPGVSDMKAGVVIFLAALDCLAAAGLLEKLPITVALNSDEERGAASSRELFKQLAGNTKAALFTECGGPEGQLVIARRGKISYRVEVHGQDMHAGDGKEVKRSALLALAHKTIEFEALNAQFEHTAVNLGRAWGGVASNTVPGRAMGLLDARYPKAKMEAEIRAAITSICAREHVPGVSTEAIETSYRPVWDQVEISRPLAELALSLAEKEVEVIDESRDGTADSNWFGAAGVPTLDGLGGIGFDEHTKDERLLLPTLFDRALLVARLIPAIDQSLARNPKPD